MRRLLALILIALTVIPTPAWARLIGNATAPVVMIQMVSSSDHVTSFTGGAGAPTCKISKNGATFATSTNAAATVSGANGWFQFSLTTIETNTNGPLAVKCTQTAADDTDYLMEVVSFNPNASIPSATAGAAGGLLIAGVNATASFTNIVWFNDGWAASRTTANSPGVWISASGNGAALSLQGFNGPGLWASATNSNGARFDSGGTFSAIFATGSTSGAGLSLQGGTTGPGLKVFGGATSGEGINIVTATGDGILVAPTAGHALTLTANGTSKHGMNVTGGTAGVSHGALFTAGTGGKDLKATSGITVDACSGCAAAGGTVIMSGVSYVKDSTSVIVDLFIKDSATLQGKTGLTSLSAGLSLNYCRVDQGNANCAAITTATATRGNYTSGGFVEKDATKAPGMYEVGLPTAVLASGADWVGLEYSGVTGTTPTRLKIELVDVGLPAIFNRVGTPTNANVSADIASVKQDTSGIKPKTDSLTFTGTLTNAFVGGYGAGQAPLQPSIAGRTLNVASGGEAGIDWSDVANATSTQTLTNTSTLSVSGSVGSVAAAVTAGTVSDKTGYSLSNPQTWDRTGNLTGNVTGSVGTVSGAVTVQQAVGTYRKNIAGQRKQPILMRSTANPQTGVTGATVTVTNSKDGAAFASTTGTVTEIANGAYVFAPSQADTNCDTCYFKASATGAVDYFFYLFTAP